MVALGATLSACSTYTEEMLGSPEDAAPRRDTPSSTDTGGPTETGVPPTSDAGADPDVSSPDSPPTIDASADRETSNDVVSPDVASDVASDSTTDRGGVDVPRVPDAADADGNAPLPDVTNDRVAPPDTADAPSVPDADADVTTGGPDAEAGVDVLPDIVDSGTTCRTTPTTHDEDGDGVVDECDNCPSIPNPNQDDVLEINAGSVADGVGDACDPRPELGGDAIYLFDGVNFASIPAEWADVGPGTWQPSGTSLSPVGTESGQELTRQFPTNLGNYLAETTFTLSALVAPGSTSIPFRMDASRNGWRCAVGINSLGEGQLLMSQVTLGEGELAPIYTSVTVPQPGDRIRLLGGGYGANIYCMLGSGTRLDRVSTSTQGNSGFRANLSRAAFEYLLIYRLGGTIP